MGIRSTNSKKTAILFPIAVAVAFFLALLLLLPRFDGAAFADESFRFTGEYVTSVEKTYDGTPSEISVEIADESDVDYKWYKKGSDGDVVFASGSTLSVKYPSHSGTYYCKAIKGSLVATTSDIKVGIGKISINLNLADKICYYGEDYEIEYSFGDFFDTETISDETEKAFIAACENSLKEQVAQSVYVKEDEDRDNFTASGHRKTGRYTLSCKTVENSIYAVRCKEGIYSVMPDTVTVSFVATNSIYGEEIKEIEYTVENPEVFAEGETDKDLKIVATRHFDDETGGIDVGRYDITGSYDNPNYNVVFRPAVYIITPKKLTGYLAGATGLVYTGKTPAVYCKLSGEGALLDLSVSVTFDKAVIDAGNDYIAYGKIDNPNYELENGGEFRFSIAKAPLIIKLKDVSYLSYVPAPEFEYYGFVNGETAEVLIDKPSIEMPTEAGVYKREPYNATATNYDISYVAGIINVYSDTMSAEGIVLKGAFVYGGKLDVETVDAKAVEGFGSIFRMGAYALKINTNGALVTDYEKNSSASSVSVNDFIAGEYSGSVECGSLFPLFLRACVIDGEGVKHKLSDFSVKDGVLYFKSNVEGTVLVYYDLMPAYIIALVLAVLIVFLVIKASRDRKKYKKALALRYAAGAIANDAIRKNPNR